MKRLAFGVFASLVAVGTTALASDSGVFFDSHGGGGGAGSGGLCTVATTCTRTADLGAQALTTTGSATVGAWSAAGALDVCYATPTTDTAPTANRLQAPNAYAQATGGNKVGATQYVTGGIGSREYSCLDIASGDVVLTTVVNGSSVALTGGVAGAGWLYGKLLHKDRI